MLLWTRVRDLERGELILRVGTTGQHFSQSLPSIQDDEPKLFARPERHLAQGHSNVVGTRRSQGDRDTQASRLERRSARHLGSTLGTRSRGSRGRGSNRRGHADRLETGVTPRLA